MAGGANIASIGSPPHNAHGERRKTEPLTLTIHHTHHGLLTVVIAAVGSLAAALHHSPTTGTALLASIAASRQAREASKGAFQVVGSGGLRTQSDPASWLWVVGCEKSVLCPYSCFHCCPMLHGSSVGGDVLHDTARCPRLSSLCTKLTTPGSLLRPRRPRR